MNIFVILILRNGIFYLRDLMNRKSWNMDGEKFGIVDKREMKTNDKQEYFFFFTIFIIG